MKLLAFVGSPRKGGNSDILTDEILRGAEEKGYEALKSVANGKSTKLVIPSEIQNVAGLFASLKEVISADSGGEKSE